MGQTIASLAEDDEFDEAFQQQQARMHLRWLQQQMQGSRIAPSIPQPGVHVAQVIDNSVHIQAKMLEFVIASDDSEIASLPCVHFVIDASCGGEAVLYRRAVLALDGNTGGWQLQGAEWTSEAVSFDAGLRQQMEVTLAAGVLTLSNAGADAASGGSSANNLKDFFAEEEVWRAGQDIAFEPLVYRCPWLIKLRAHGETVNVEWTAFRATKGSTSLKEKLTRLARGGRSVSTMAVEVISQQCLCGDGPLRELLEVYGSEIGPQGVRSDCIVCQSDPCDTMLLPCRHLCLCNACAEYIRTRTQAHSYKCPVCRKRISRFMYAADGLLDCPAATPCQAGEVAA